MATHRTDLYLALFLFSMYFAISAVDFGYLRDYSQDLYTYYLAPKAFSAGVDAYDQASWRLFASSNGVRVHSFVYSPIFALFFLPLSSLSIQEVQVAWFFINQLFIASSIILLHKKLRLDKIRVSLLYYVPFIYLLHLNNSLGQNSALLLFLISATIYLHDRMPSLSGAAAVLSFFSKSHMFPLPLLFFARRDYPAAAGVLVSAALLFSASLVYFGLSPWVGYITYSREYMEQVIWEGRSVWGKASEIAGLDAETTYPLYALIVLAAFLTASKSMAPPLAVSYTLSTILIISPLLHGHHLVYLLPASLLLLAYEAAEGRRHYSLAGIVLLMLGLSETEMTAPMVASVAYFWAYPLILHSRASGKSP